jgi:hypothetical protein
MSKQDLCIVEIDLQRLRDNLSQGVGWKPRTKVTEEKMLRRLEELGFVRNPDGLTWTARTEDVRTLRPDEVLSSRPAPQGHKVKPPQTV